MNCCLRNQKAEEHGNINWLYWAAQEVSQGSISKARSSPALSQHKNVSVGTQTQGFPTLRQPSRPLESREG